MIFYKHRANNLNDPLKYKALEIDIKWDTYHQEIILGHDCCDFKCCLIDYLDKCNEETELAINIKQSGLVNALNCEYYKSKFNKLKSYFFFDMSIPDLLEYIKICPEHTAFRMSEYELRFYDECKWIWLDFFNNEFDICMYDTIIKSDKNIVIVSPELHNNKNNLNIDNIIECYGICTDII